MNSKLSQRELFQQQLARLTGSRKQKEIRGTGCSTGSYTSNGTLQCSPVSAPAKDSAVLPQPAVWGSPAFWIVITLVLLGALGCFLSDACVPECTPQAIETDSR